MITIFCTPKNFENIFDHIQTNAINSWRELGENIEIIIFGNSYGTKKIAEDINALHISDVKTNDNGVPFLSDLFKKADQLTSNDMLMFINSDIILPPNFISAIKKIKNLPSKFLMIGHRWDCNINYKIDFKTLSSDKQFWRKIFINSIKHSPSGIDYFIFKKKTFENLPDFVVGRPGYDNWIVWNARRRWIPVIDLSNEIKVFHQNHHFKFHNLKKDPKIFMEEDGLKNMEIIGKNVLNILDANYLLIKNKIIKNLKIEFKNRNLGKLQIIYPECAYILDLYKRIKRRLKRIIEK